MTLSFEVLAAGGESLDKTVQLVVGGKTVGKLTMRELTKMLKQRHRQSGQD